MMITMITPNQIRRSEESLAKPSIFGTAELSIRGSTIGSTNTIAAKPSKNVPKTMKVLRMIVRKATGPRLSSIRFLPGHLESGYVPGKVKKR